MSLTLNFLYHTIPHELFRCKVEDVYGLQSFISTHSEDSDSLPFFLCLLQKKLFICVFSKQNSAFSSQEWVWVFSVHHCHQEVKSQMNLWNNTSAVHFSFGSIVEIAV